MSSSHAIFEIAKYPPFEINEWYASKRLNLIIGEGPTTESLKGTPEPQLSSDRAFMEIEVGSAFALPTTHVLLGPPIHDGSRCMGTYKCEEGESLLRWLVEMNIVIFTRQLWHTHLQVAYAMARLAGRAKSWAFGKSMAELQRFPTYQFLSRNYKQLSSPRNVIFTITSKKSASWLLALSHRQCYACFGVHLRTPRGTCSHTTFQRNTLNRWRLRSAARFERNSLRSMRGLTGQTILSPRRDVQNRTVAQGRWTCRPSKPKEKADLKGDLPSFIAAMSSDNSPTSAALRHPRAITGDPGKINSDLA
jgi:hypothetical protein